MSDNEARSVRRQIGSDYVAWLAFQGLFEQLLKESTDLRLYRETIG
ncbi:hypothetical protein ACTMU2_07875 [Cupriavidus basilensis]